MKKLFLLMAILGLGLTSVKAQKHFTFGLNAGIPLSDVEDTHNFYGSADIAYRVDIIKLLDIGGAIGYSHFFKDNDLQIFDAFDHDDLQFITAAGTARLRILAILFAGTDLGYAIGLGSDSDGGLFLRPHLGVNLGIANVLVSYTNISADGDNVASINGGVEIKF
ncbi:hypothetical protein ML462_09150 [Gramella lutea]|uniref:Outer membrane protein beta-barrel domain-containing protein n=1 Tax=Christiangramia lutea TaxID=1607951 RepID=A0A9X1V2S1_9FLAO|nr:hypothetical protein [Christiangramia lutea]MCH4823342.1 hypothetical protein [Christiangramia lutea]